MDSAIILIHGMWSTSATLSTLRRRLEAKGYIVYSPDLPFHEDGIHDSEVLVANLSVRDYCTHLKDYITNLKLGKPPILIGHSMGGILAQKLGVELENHALILLCPSPPWGINLITPSGAWTTLDAWAKWRFWEKSHRPSFHRAKYGLFNLLDNESQIKLYDRLIHESGRAYFEIVYWFLDKMKATYVPTKEIKVPILVIAGEKDRIIPPSVVKKVAEKYPQADYKCYSDHSHWLIDELGSEKIVNDIDIWIKNKFGH